MQTEMEYQGEADDAHTGVHSMNLDQDMIQRDEAVMQAQNARHEVDEGKKEIEVIRHQLEETKKKNSDLEKHNLI